MATATAALLLAFAVIPPPPEGCDVARAALALVNSGQGLHLTPTAVGFRTRSQASVRVPSQFRAKGRGEPINLTACSALGLSKVGDDLVLGDVSQLTDRSKMWLSDPVFSADRKTVWISFGAGKTGGPGMGMRFVQRDGAWENEDEIAVWFTTD